MLLLYCMRYIMFMMHLFNNREQRYIAIEGVETDKCEEEANKFAKYSLISKDYLECILQTAFS